MYNQDGVKTVVKKMILYIDNAMSMWHGYRTYLKGEKQEDSGRRQGKDGINYIGDEESIASEKEEEETQQTQMLTDPQPLIPSSLQWHLGQGQCYSTVNSTDMIDSEEKQPVETLEEEKRTEKKHDLEVNVLTKCGNGQQRLRHGVLTVLNQILSWSTVRIPRNNTLKTQITSCIEIKNYIIFEKYLVMKKSRITSTSNPLSFPTNKACMSRAKNNTSMKKKLPKI